MDSFGAEIDAQLAAQERCDALRRRVMLTAGRNLCDLAYANPYDEVPTAITDAIRVSLDSGRELDLQYTPFGGSTLTRRLVGQSLSATHGGRFPWKHVVLTPGAAAALNLILRALPDGDRPNDRGEVLIISPCWIDTPLYVSNLGLKPVLVPVDPETLHLDLASIQAALGANTRAIILSQPANPTGVLYGVSELRELAAMLSRCDPPPVLISDECHRDFVFDGSFRSPAVFYDATCVVHSFGKRFFIQGQRIGYVAVSPRMQNGEAFAHRLERLCRIMGFSTPTALMQIAIRRLLDLPTNTEPFARRRARAIQGITEAGLSLRQGEATFFLYPRTPDGRDDFAFAEELGELGVLVLPAPVFHHQGHFRVSLTCTDEMLERALDVLATVAR